jgi:hypothetical protein
VGIHECSVTDEKQWMHIDSSSYGDAKTGVATSDSICGAPYTYMLEHSHVLLHSTTNLNSGSTQPLGFQSRDMNLFKGRLKFSSHTNQSQTNSKIDTDGSAYLLTEDVRLFPS